MFIQNTGCVVRHGPCRFHLSDKTKGSDRNLPLPSNGAKLHILTQPSNVGGSLESASCRDFTLCKSVRRKAFWLPTMLPNRAKI